ncbi:hypothetical protein [Rheinheimera soli]|uniref:hypothetical protein n=1 Tax=Rheinheimera soli TaxID=443616 RepID=UPI001E4660AE|nr:hypothetical protein [Rheinheimera soli]
MFKTYPLWLLLFSVTTAAAASESCPTPLRTYHFFDRSGQSLSCMDQWQTEFFNELGCPLEFLNYNPQTTQRETMLQQQKIELLAGLTQSPQRNYKFSAAFAEHQFQLYRLHTAVQWQNIRDWCDDTMRQAIIIIPAQGYIGEEIEILRTNKECSKMLLPAPVGQALALTMLKKNRADLLLSSDLWLRRMPAEQADDYVALPFYKWRDPTRIAFSSAVSDEFIHKVNTQIQRHRAEGKKVCDMDLPSNG